MEKILDFFKNRFRKINRDEWIVIAALLVVLAILLWFSIGMSISLSQGFTLFGDPSNTTGKVETDGPTSSDITVLSLFWVLTVLILAIFVYRLFFRKIEKTNVVRKEIVNGKTIIVKEEGKDDEGNTSSGSREN